MHCPYSHNLSSIATPGQVVSFAQCSAVPFTHLDDVGCGNWVQAQSHGPNLQQLRQDVLYGAANNCQITKLSHSFIRQRYDTGGWPVAGSSKKAAGREKNSSALPLLQCTPGLVLAPLTSLSFNRCLQPKR